MPLRWAAPWQQRGRLSQGFLVRPSRRRPPPRTCTGPPWQGLHYQTQMRTLCPPAWPDGQRMDLPVLNRLGLAPLGTEGRRKVAPRPPLMLILLVLPRRCTYLNRCHSRRRRLSRRRRRRPLGRLPLLRRSCRLRLMDGGVSGREADRESTRSLQSARRRQGRNPFRRRQRLVGGVDRGGTRKLQQPLCDGHLVPLPLRNSYHLRRLASGLACHGSRWLLQPRRRRTSRKSRPRLRLAADLGDLERKQPHPHVWPRQRKRREELRWVCRHLGAGLAGPERCRSWALLLRAARQGPLQTRLVRSQPRQPLLLKRSEEVSAAGYDVQPEKGSVVGRRVLLGDGVILVSQSSLGVASLHQLVRL